MVIDEREGRARAEEGGTLMIAREGDGAKTNVVAVCQESREVYALFGERESVASECSLSLPFSLPLSPALSSCYCYLLLPELAVFARASATATAATFGVRLQNVGLKCFTDVIKVSFLIWLSIYKRTAMDDADADAVAVVRCALCPMPTPMPLCTVILRSPSPSASVPVCVQSKFKCRWQAGSSAIHTHTQVYVCVCVCLSLTHKGK